jgi:sulfite reductase (NADPH) hemoprotein beta-component
MVSSNETLKESSPSLAGTIAATLADSAKDRFSEDDVQFLKFHGIYQQDDRDLRKTGKKYIFMVRLRLPAGVVTPAQYLACDELAHRYGNDTLRVTSRQSLQFHGTVKSGLGPLIKSLNEALITSLAACGDVNRNVMAPPTPATDGLGALVRKQAAETAAALSPQTKAYHSIWVEGTELNLEEQNFVDPLYGKSYLPRKFKIGFAIPPLNDVDIYANCCGFITIASPEGRLLGYNLTAGGGMGRSHGNTATFPRLADVIGFLPADKVTEVAKAVVAVHRDFGDRTNRKHARLKYVLEDRGVDWFRAEVERLVGFELGPAKPFKFERQGDAFGWHRQADGRLFLGLFIETGRIRDREGCRLKSALREVVERYQPEIRLTPSNNMLLVNIPPEQKEAITDRLRSHGVRTEISDQGSVVRRASMACVALPTCGLALAESERYLPSLMTSVEQILAELGMADEEISIRMTGCPNGCARPYLSEIGLVGKAPGRYQLYLGGSAVGTRLNRLYRDNVKDTEIIQELRPILSQYQRERLPAERFGDWVERIFWTQQQTSTLNGSATTSAVEQAVTK